VSALLTRHTHTHTHWTTGPSALILACTAQRVCQTYYMTSSAEVIIYERRSAVCKCTNKANHAPRGSAVCKVSRRQDGSRCRRNCVFRLCNHGFRRPGTDVTRLRRRTTDQRAISGQVLSFLASRCSTLLTAKLIKRRHHALPLRFTRQHS